MATKDERDDFWDIDKLVPKKKTVISSFRTSPATVTYTADGEEDKGKDERKINFEAFKGVASSEDTVYDKGDNGLIRRVTIKRFVDKYDFYGSFRKAALLYYDYSTEKCNFVSFYSYMPQYSQLNAEQNRYYFYWRSMLRRGIYLKSDYSYIYLYVYEILNLPDKISPKEGIQLLCNLWKEYRETLPRLDAYFSLWVEDYCLVYNLPCPTELIRPFIADAIAVSGFKEFYLCELGGTDEGGVDSTLAYLSDYDWRRGKFSGGENAEIYKSHMLRAMRRLLLSLDLSASDGRLSVLKRDAFSHSLCTHAVKCKLEVEYIPLGNNDRMRGIVTQAVRYTENKLRALLGIKSRLAVKDLSDTYKSIIDRYFRILIDEETKKRNQILVPEYEKLYDAPEGSLSFEGADEIELASWSTTKRLVEEEIEEESPDYTQAEYVSETETVEETAVAQTSDDSGIDAYGLSLEEINAIKEIFDGNSTDDSSAERINEAFADNFGDIILEFDGEKYRVLEDYEEEIREWLSKIMK